MKHTEFENLIFFFFEKTKEKPLSMYTILLTTVKLTLKFSMFAQLRNTRYDITRSN